MKFAVFALLGLAADDAAPQLLKGQSLVDHINANTKSWVATLTDDRNKRKVMKAEFARAPEGYPVADEIDIGEAQIPVNFDARIRWPGCKYIGSIRDQSYCGACWAFGAAECMTDRTCIASGQKTNDILSVDDILACVSTNEGCEGGFPIDAWRYWVHKGVCTGGSNLLNTGCKPYPFAPCGEHNGTYHKDCPEPYETPKCDSKCQDGYPVLYADDKHYGKSAYTVGSSVRAIQKEIMTNGPVEAAFMVYEDFPYYKSGVYHHVSGGADSGHAVKVLGWGTDNGEDYWLAANSWDTDWGESGFFRIRRGTNECGFESAIVAGLPK